MSRIINDEGLRTHPLDLALGATSYGERRIEFFHYIRHTTAPPLPHAYFPQFSRLPIELRNQIVSLCDNSTLFRLMQVSSAIRTEARKHFWSDPDVLYCIDAHFLLAGGLPGQTDFDLEFLAYVKHLEIDIDSMSDFTKVWEYSTERWPRPGDSSVNEIELIGTFWQTINRVFPRVTDIVVCETTPRSNKESLPDALTMVALMCPASINVSASYLWEVTDNSTLLQRRLWRRQTDNGALDELEEISTPRPRQSVLPPLKHFYGPVGMFMRSNYRFYRLYSLRMNGTRLLLLEARERHQFDNRHEPFSCFQPACDARFDERGQWTSHATLTRHDIYHEPPDEFRVLYQQREEAIQDILHRTQADLKVIAENFGEKGSSKRHDAIQAFLHQLDNDPLYMLGKPAKDTVLWKEYSGGLAMRERK